ncbi:MAG: 3-dehydroquinate synthase [Candidatus Binatia bacterium]
MKSSGKQRAGARQTDVLTVDLGARAYPIVIGGHVLDELGPRMAERLGTGSAAVITNPTVGGLYLERVESSLRAAGFAVTTVDIPDGEEHKSLESLARIYDRLLAERPERNSPIVALGGGVIGDLAGFAAATLLRGVPFVQVPTTLLAQVDSSVGGKTGVNHPAGKNLIGAFYQPRLVLIDIATLKTLPRRQLAAGLAEVIKYGAILDAELFTLLERDLDRVLALDDALIRNVVRRCCELKAMVVQRDEQETDYRSILNFGHTLGHAVEALTGYRRYLHGEAVAIGMVVAARVSCLKGHCERQAFERLTQLVQRAGLPTAMPHEFPEPQLAAVIGGDKKVARGKVKFVCIEDVGRARFEHLRVPELAALAAQ